MRFVPRSLENRLESLLRTFPVVLVHGPRQSGKSTFVRHALRSWHRFDLERPADLGILTADLEGFFETHPRRVVLDEAQRLPELFPVLRHVVDRSPGRGRYVLLGSSSPALLQTASTALAGRLGFLELAPFSAGELAAARPGADRWFWGGYPPVHALRRNPERLDWLDAYVASYLERELPALGFRLPAQRLRSLWTMLTHVHGSLLNTSDLARSLAVSSHTVADHLDVLESTFMIRRLRPFHANIQKRLVKSPKVYVRDTGLLHFLAGLRQPAELRTWPRRGHSFEGLVLEELAGLARVQRPQHELFFWRTHAGAEVDLLLRHGRTLVPVEIKLGVAVRPDDVAGLRSCLADLGIRRGWVVYTGSRRESIGRSIECVPWRDVVEGRFELP